MRAVYLSARPAELARVYGAEERARIAALLGGEPEERDSLPDDAGEVEFLFSTWGMPPLTAEEIASRLPRLKAVFYAAGSVQGFARPFLESGVRVFSAWKANGVAVAQYVLAQILLASKGYFPVQALARESRAEAKSRFAKYPGAYGEKVGVLGCGAIGSMVCAQLAKTDLKPLVYDPYLSEERAAALGARRASLEEIFRECLIVTNHIPNLPSTVGVIRREHLLSLRPYSTFINTGRGPQLDESDLLDALRADPTRTALLDVLTDEANSDDSPLVRLPNCFLTPHIAGSNGQELRRMANRMADALEATLRGEPCDCEVTADMLKTMA